MFTWSLFFLNTIYLGTDTHLCISVVVRPPLLYLEQPPRGLGSLSPGGDHVCIETSEEGRPTDCSSGPGYLFLWSTGLSSVRITGTTQGWANLPPSHINSRERPDVPNRLGDGGMASETERAYSPVTPPLPSLFSLLLPLYASTPFPSHAMVPGHWLLNHAVPSIPHPPGIYERIYKETSIEETRNPASVPVHIVQAHPEERVGVVVARDAQAARLRVVVEQAIDGVLVCAALGSS